jgi:hypothetical protein
MTDNQRSDYGHKNHSKMAHKFVHCFKPTNRIFYVQMNDTRGPITAIKITQKWLINSFIGLNQPIQYFMYK